MDWGFDNTFARELAWLGVPVDPAPVAAPSTLLVNDDLATELGLDPEWLVTPDGLAVLAGNAHPVGGAPLAQAYAGHQFGQFNPLLGDGRAVVLGEVVDAAGRRRDIGLKGSGRTPFSRGGDGRAALGPVLREYILGEAMHALGIPTTRALAAVATGEQVIRADGPLPGAVLTRVAASHLRVGTAQLVSSRASEPQQRAFTAYVARRHHPQVEPEDSLGLLEAVIDAQARLIAQWMAVGFVHGVMNTDNMTLSGETIDYGPCAFLEAHDPAALFSSIDTAGRYRFGAQPTIGQWNLARYAESLLPLLAPDPQRSPEVIEQVTNLVGGFEGRYEAAYLDLMGGKLGLGPEALGDNRIRDRSPRVLIDDLRALLRIERLDHTRTFRLLGRVVRGQTNAVRALVNDVGAWDEWQGRWLAAVGLVGRPADQVAEAMDAVNPGYVPRNHLVEDALAAAQVGELAPVQELLAAVRDPFVERPGWDRFAAPAPAGFTERYVTFCGT